ncbi:hypothetical protein BDV26DRAFT_274208 [Aspergillus bertholletiae]|uniref:Hydrophobin n=1 Tax=Aspergillus bertholletiae TaxID=1226010 RepID=A0A5N7AUD3_9EURO|nr:hypothetical protein BDV26DRAFT_274208 [Aspergillus bertholletiae]
MKFFAVAALFAAAAMAAPPAAAGNGNPTVIQAQQKSAFAEKCSANGNEPVCCENVDVKNTQTVSKGGLLNNLLGSADLSGILGEGGIGLINNLIPGTRGSCAGLVSALNKQCQTNIGCCKKEGDVSQEGIANINAELPCLLSQGL